MIAPLDLQTLELSRNAQAVLRTLLSLADGKVRGKTVSEVREHGELGLAAWYAGNSELVARGIVSRRKAGYCATTNFTLHVPDMTADRRALLEAIAAEIRGHVPCGFEICEQAQHLVPGEGDPGARVVFVGEAPGAQEDRTGRPFVGNAGRLLDGVLDAAGLARDEVFIANVVRARPPGNRDPRADEVAHHLPWLAAQLGVIQPELVVPLGRHALARFTADARISEVHGRVVEADGRRLFPMYHPAAALHNPSLRETLLEDARALRAALPA
jgi:uracil-DNA glycosylase family 4